MPSIIPGYEYDIFISYRQSDNKYDGWVTEFVHHLKDELEATFKEEINVYFDENPHDGLLETHDVDQSLDEKVKALIFLPIVSQTYCDPHCFAWQKEFLAFRNFANEDAFGLDIKLASGNVAKRILPVRIHDIDDGDKSLLEKEIGGVMRSIDFIYQEPGVNRPLRSNEEHPDDNLNHTLYRNQINKVANAIKEIIYGLDNQNFLKKTPEKAFKIKEKSHPFLRKSNRLKILYLLPIILLSLLVVYYFVGSQKNDSPVLPDELTMAILPLKNLTGDPKEQYFVEGLTEELIAKLYPIQDLKVSSWFLVEKYKNSSLSLSEIAGEIGVNLILEGSVRKADNLLRVNVQLINASNGFQIWVHTFDSELKNVIKAQEACALLIADALNLHLNPSIPNPFTVTDQQESEEVYEYFLKGWTLIESMHGDTEVFEDKIDAAVEHFNNALSINPDHAPSIAGLSLAKTEYKWRGFDKDGKHIHEAGELARKAIEIDPDLGLSHFALGYLSINDNAIKELSLSLEFDSTNVLAWCQLAYVCNVISPADYQFAEKAARKAVQLRPSYIWGHFLLGDALNGQNRYQEAIAAYEYSVQLKPDYPYGYLRIAFGAKQMGDFSKALLSYQKVNNIRKTLHSQVLESEMLLRTGNKNKAFELLKEAINNGYDDFDYLISTPYFEEIREDKLFKDLLQEVKSSNQPN